MNFSSVVTLHLSKYGCGVGRFSGELARRLGVPLVGFDDVAAYGDFPLFSLKWSEMDPPRWHGPARYGLFWHDGGAKGISVGAEHIFYADPSLGPWGLWCPSLIAPRKRPVRLFSFGMAGRLQVEKYRRLREISDASGHPYHLRVSVGLHEGTSLDSVERHFDDLKEIMGPDNVTILGILSDDAVLEELHNCDYVVAFFEKGLRANNTTVNAAIEAHCEVISNWDEATTVTMRERSHNIDTMVLRAEHPYSWDALIDHMERICERSKSLAE